MAKAGGNTGSKRRIKFVPRWQGAIEGHAVNTVRRFFPGLCAEHEFDDLLQEAYLVYMRCKAKYPNIDNPAWFMAMFSRSLQNKLINMKALTGRMVSLEVLEDDYPEPGVEGEEFAACLLGQLPLEIKQLINAVCFGPGAEGRAAYRKLQELFPSLT